MSIYYEPIIMMPKHSIESQWYWCLIYWASIEPLSHIVSYWCLLHSIELFWCLMLCCIELSSLHLNWAHIMRLWTVRMHKLRNMALMVDGKSWKLDYITRIGANCLPCIGLYPYFGSDGCKKARSEFPLLHLVQTYITFLSLAWLLQTFPFFCYLVTFFLQPG